MKKKKYSDKEFEKLLDQIAAEDRVALITEKDVEFLRSIGIDTDLETFKKRSIEAAMEKWKNL